MATVHPRDLTAAADTPTDGARRRAPHLDVVSPAVHRPYHERLDPFFDRVLWDDPVRLTGRWHHQRTVDENSGRAYLERVPDYLPADSPQFTRLTTSIRARELVATLHTFRHMDAMQLQAWLGVDRRNFTLWAKPLFDCGIVMRGTHNVKRMHGRLPYLYALNDDRPLRLWLRRLGKDTARQLLGTDDGLPRFSPRYLRHNLLVSEVALRSLETSAAWIAVDGEQRASTATLLPVAQQQQDVTRPLSADTVLWRGDGMRVAVEVMASSNWSHLRSRLGRWAQQFAVLGPDANLTLVWLNAASDGHEKVAAKMRRLFDDVVAYGKVTDEAGMPVSPARIELIRSRMLLASWRDWYPDRQQVSLAGARLTCARRTERGWAAVDVADLDEHPNPAGFVHAPPEGLVTPAWAGEAPTPTRASA